MSVFAQKHRYMNVLSRDNPNSMNTIFLPVVAMNMLQIKSILG